MDIQKYEYTTVNLSKSHTFFPDAKATINNLGDKGWELVPFVSYLPEKFLLFKRIIKKG